MGQKKTNKQRKQNLDSVLPYSKSVITTISTIWLGIPFYLWWWTLAAISDTLAYPPQTDVGRLLSISYHLFHQYSTPAKPRGAATFDTTHWWWGRESVVWLLRPRLLAFGDQPAITQPQGATEEFSDTFSPTREQMTPHTGHTGHSLTTPRAEHPRQHIFTHDIPVQALDAVSLCQWPTSLLKQISQHHGSVPFLHKKKHPLGGPTKTQATPIKHTSTDADRSKTPFLKLSTFMDSGVLFFSPPIPSSPFPSSSSSLCCTCVVCVVSFSLFFCTGP